MQETNESTLRMIDAFVSRYKNGETVIVAEIADEFEVSKTTVYRYLETIAKKLGVERDDLKQRVFEADHSGHNYTPVKRVDAAEALKRFNTLKGEALALEAAIGQSLEELEIMDTLLQEEFEK